MKLDIQLVTAAVLSVGGLVLLFCGAFIAPQGEVHESICRSAIWDRLHV